MRARALKILLPGLLISAFYLIINATGMPRATSRIAILLVLWPLVNAWILWYGISPKSKMMNPDPQFDNNRNRHSLELRLVLVAFALVMAYWMTLPLMGDLIGLISGAPLLVKRNVVALHEVGGTADSYIYQAVEFSDQANNVEAYTFFLFPARTRHGVAYDFSPTQDPHNPGLSRNQESTVSDMDSGEAAGEFLRVTSCPLWL
ncbi:MAG TPA: hypothetical protein VN517_01465 [Terriglobales bacterium]|nr:hypothetical protein [Terriglobales bacterium]